ncbi:MAG: porin family protein [Cytophagia bacterium]|nr:porin family protein [Cytophagia bacterium]
MRNFVIIAILVLFTTTVKAQTAKGNMVIGGSFRFSSTTQQTTNDDLKSSSFGISPSFGYFVSDNLAVGVNVGFNSVNYTNDDKQSEFDFGPFVRYYKFIADDKFAFTADAGFGLGSGKYDSQLSGERKTSSFNVYVSPGFAYFFSPKWSLDFQLQGISYSTNDPNKDADNDKGSYFTFGVSSFSPSLGFRYFIGN